MADGLNAELARRLREVPGLDLRPGEPLARYTTFRIGGPAELLVTAASERANLMPAIMQAVTAYATVGEITAVLKEVFGTYQEPVRF